MIVTKLTFTDQRSAVQISKTVQDAPASISEWLDALRRKAGYEILHAEGLTAALKIEGRPVKLEFTLASADTEEHLQGAVKAGRFLKN